MLEDHLRPSRDERGRFAAEARPRRSEKVLQHKSSLAMLVRRHSIRVPGTPALDVRKSSASERGVCVCARKWESEVRHSAVIHRHTSLKPKSLAPLVEEL